MTSFIRRTGDWMTTYPPTSFNGAVVVLVQTYNRANNNYFSNIATKTRPEIIPSAAICRDISPSKVQKPVPNE